MKSYPTYATRTPPHTHTPPSLQCIGTINRMSNTITQAARPSYRTSHTYLTPKRPGSPTTVGRTPGHHVSTMLREAPICAPQAEQDQRVGRSAAPPPHALRRGMTDAAPCCSHDVRQRECAGGLAWQPPKREAEPPRLAWKQVAFFTKSPHGLVRGTTPLSYLKVVLATFPGLPRDAGRRRLPMEG